jgi:RND family efflux transporter MFP subunit
MNKIVRFIVVLVLLAGMVLLVKTRRAQMQSAKPYGVRPLAVRVAPVQKGVLERYNEYVGVVEAAQVAKVASRISARVNAVSCREGDAVKPGDLLVQLDDRDIRAQIKATQASIESLKINADFWARENERDRLLLEGGVIAPAAAEATQSKKAEADARLKATERELENLRTKLQYTQLTAPFAGVVSSREVDPGDLAAPGLPLMVVEDHATLKVAFEAPQEDLRFLKKGAEVEIRLNGAPQTVQITRVFPSLNKARMVRVEAKLPEGSSVHIGAFVPLRIVWLRHPGAVTVPQEAGLENAEGKDFVFVVENGQLALRPVERVEESDGRVEVKGVQPGEQVVISTFLGWANLADGLKVEVAK